MMSFVAQRTPHKDSCRLSGHGSITYPMNRLSDLGLDVFCASWGVAVFVGTGCKRNKKHGAFNAMHGSLLTMCKSAHTNKHPIDGSLLTLPYCTCVIGEGCTASNGGLEARGTDSPNGFTVWIRRKVVPTTVVLCESHLC
jgi:hypothetical protein